MDDISGEVDHDIDIGRRTWNRASVPIQQDAFREGYDEGRQAQFQQGFDMGYSEGFQNGFKMGLVNAATRAAKELESKEIDNLELNSYEMAHRGLCVMCPPGSEPITKEKIAEISSHFYSLDEALQAQRKTQFPEDSIKTLSSLLLLDDTSNTLRELLK